MEAVDKVYDKIKQKLGIPKRVVRWYVTEELIPQPEHQGREAYYDLDKTQLMSRLELIQVLQRKFNYKLDGIKPILKLYEGHAFDRLLTMTEVLAKDYPLYTEVNVGGEKSKLRDSLNSVIHNEFLIQLEKGELDVENFKLLDLVGKIKKWSFEDYNEYACTEESYMKRFKD